MSSAPSESPAAPENSTLPEKLTRAGTGLAVGVSATAALHNYIPTGNITEDAKWVAYLLTTGVLSTSSYHAQKYAIKLLKTLMQHGSEKATETGKVLIDGVGDNLMARMRNRFKPAPSHDASLDPDTHQVLQALNEGRKDPELINLIDGKLALGGKVDFPRVFHELFPAVDILIEAGESKRPKFDRLLEHKDLLARLLQSGEISNPDISRAFVGALAHDPDSNLPEVYYEETTLLQIHGGDVDVGIGTLRDNSQVAALLLRNVDLATRIGAVVKLADLRADTPDIAPTPTPAAPHGSDSMGFALALSPLAYPAPINETPSGSSALSLKAYSNAVRKLPLADVIMKLHPDATMSERRIASNAVEKVFHIPSQPSVVTLGDVFISDGPNSPNGRGAIDLYRYLARCSSRAAIEGLVRHFPEALPTDLDPSAIKEVLSVVERPIRDVDRLPLADVITRLHPQAKLADRSGNDFEPEALYELPDRRTILTTDRTWVSSGAGNPEGQGAIKLYQYLAGCPDAEAATEQLQRLFAPAGYVPTGHNGLPRPSKAILQASASQMEQTAAQPSAPRAFDV